MCHRFMMGPIAQALPEINHWRAQTRRGPGTTKLLSVGRDTFLRAADGPRRPAGAGDHGLLLGDQGPVDGDGRVDIRLARAHASARSPAVVLGFVGFVGALALQFHMRRYLAWTYWLAVVGVGVFGTMAADVLHVGFGVPYPVSTVLYAVVLAAVFVTWQKTEKTLSIHSIDTARREAFYWAAVVATFAMGTALGDLTATTFGLGYLASAFLFAGIIAIPAIGYWKFGWNPIFSFWFAYVVTRPLGASFADWMGKPQERSAASAGAAVPVALGFAAAIFGLVAYLAVTRRRRAGGRPWQAPRRPGPALRGDAGADRRGLSTESADRSAVELPRVVDRGIPRARPGRRRTPAADCR